MRIRTGLVTAMAAAFAARSACASAPTINVGWDEKVSFAADHAWAWRPDGSIKDPVRARRCQDVISDPAAGTAAPKS